MLRFSADEDIQQNDIYASILADLLEHLDKAFEAEWTKDPDDYFDESIEIQNRVKLEADARTSDFVWDVLLLSSSKRLDQELKEQLEEAKSEQESKRLSDALLRTMGRQRYSQLSEQERQSKLIELKRLERQSRASSSVEKVLADFNGNQAAYEQYKNDEKQKQKAEIEAKIARLKARFISGSNLQLSLFKILTSKGIIGTSGPDSGRS